MWPLWFQMSSICPVIVMGCASLDLGFWLYYSIWRSYSHLWPQCTYHVNYYSFLWEEQITVICEVQLDTVISWIGVLTAIDFDFKISLMPNISGENLHWLWMYFQWQDSIYLSLSQIFLCSVSHFLILPVLIFLKAFLRDLFSSERVSEA